jgi:hypothetical protein
MRASLALLFALFTLAACRSNSEPPKPPEADSLLHAVPLAKGNQSGMRGEGYFVARTQEEWLALWKEHASSQIPPPPAPQVGWASQMVIGVVLGQRPSAGYGVAFTALDRGPGKLIARVKEMRPDPKSPQAAVMTRPFCFMAIPRSDDRVEFRLE